MFDARSNPNLVMEPEKHLVESEERDINLKEAEGGRMWKIFNGTVSTSNTRVTNIEAYSHIYLPDPLQLIKNTI